MTTSTRERHPADRRPIILMTPDFKLSAEGWTEREYVVRANYAEAISDAGGTAFILPYETLDVAAALELADGVMITGSTPGLEATQQRRDFELELVRHTLQAGKPLLGICHGMQLVGEWLGGTFVTSLPGTSGTAAVDHLPAAVPDRPAHWVTIDPQSELAKVVCEGEIEVNSLHRHSLVGEGRFRVAARARDGIIEALEGEGSGFCLGVQWHPEYRLTDADRAILRDFVRRSAEHPRDKADEDGCPVRERLAAMGLAIPEATAPPGAFVGAIRTGDTVTVSGQVPVKNNTVLKTGHLGADVSLEAGRESARWALLNALAQLERIAGRLDRIQGFVRLAGYVAAAPDFTQHGAVIDGASELLREIFPESWPHARVAIGVASLPRGVPVEIELTAVLREARD